MLLLISVDLRRSIRLADYLKPPGGCRANTSSKLSDECISADQSASNVETEAVGTISVVMGTGCTVKQRRCSFVIRSMAIATLTLRVLFDFEAVATTDGVDLC